MIETTGDLWELAREADAVVITTNGAVNKKGEAVMGRGCALEAKQKFPWLAKAFATKLVESGNHVHQFTISPEQGMQMSLVTFPVKKSWFELADFVLIRRSGQELVALANVESWKKVVMPRPGCGNGGLEWGAVKQVLEDVLDERFFVTTYAT